MSDLALQSTCIYPMAARCGVFAKTDIQNLMARNLPEADIAASIFHSIAVQTVTSLSHGCNFAAPILLCGGPLTFLPALRKAFADYLHMPTDDFIVLEDGNLIPAMGCAIKAIQGKEIRLSDLRSTFKEKIHEEKDAQTQSTSCKVKKRIRLQPSHCRHCLPTKRNIRNGCNKNSATPPLFTQCEKVWSKLFSASTLGPPQQRLLPSGLTEKKRDR